MIYKDECAKSFDNPMSEGGINVSLKDFVGFSEMYSKINFKQKGHPIYLNIKKIPRKDKELTKVTKVAIGKPGGIDADTDNYDTEVKVFCYACNMKLDESHEKIKPLVDSILLA